MIAVHYSYRSGAQINIGRLMMRYGRDVEIEAIRRRLRCQHCGERCCRLMHGWDVGRFHHRRTSTALEP